MAKDHLFVHSRLQAVHRGSIDHPNSCWGSVQACEDRVSWILLPKWCPLSLGGISGALVPDLLACFVLFILQVISYKTILLVYCSDFITCPSTLSVSSYCKLLIVFSFSYLLVSLLFSSGHNYSRPMSQSKNPKQGSTGTNSHNTCAKVHLSTLGSIPDCMGVFLFPTKLRCTHALLVKMTSGCLLFCYQAPKDQISTVPCPYVLSTCSAP